VRHEGVGRLMHFRSGLAPPLLGLNARPVVCPWKKSATRFEGPDFRARNDLDRATLANLFAWTEEQFLQRTEGSAIRRTGYEGWLRNIAIALGNAPRDPAVIETLAMRRDDPSPVVREHVAWALAKQSSPRL